MTTSKIIKIPIGNSLTIPCRSEKEEEDFTDCLITAMLKNRSGKGRLVGNFTVELGNPVGGKIKNFLLKMSSTLTSQFEIDEIHGFDIKFTYPSGIVTNSPIVLVQFIDRVTD